VLVEAQTRRRAREHARERRLSHLKRVAPQVVAIEFYQIERVEEHAPVVPAIADEIEARDAVVAAGDRLAVDDAAQLSQPINDQREAHGQVIARPAV
jgi:hypothetical protein